jgi:hypothetical protein
VAAPFRRQAREELLLPPGGYTLDESDPDVLVLRRADDSFVAAFSSRGVRSEGTREAVEADLREREPFARVPRAFPPGIAGHRRRRDDPGTCLAEAGSGGTRIDGTLRREGHPTGPPYYLVARRRPRGAQVLTIDGIGRGLALPVFSFQEGAREFLRSYASNGDWEATSISIGRLLLLLCGCCAEVGCVALDLSPEIIAEGATGLVSLSRQSFVDSLLGRGRIRFEDRYREEGQTHE